MGGTFLWRGSGVALDLAADWTGPALGAGPAAVAPGTADSATIDTTAMLDATGTLAVARLVLAGELGLSGAAAIAVGAVAPQAGGIAVGPGATLLAGGGALGLFAPVTGSGTLAIAAGATLFAAAAVGAGLTAAFQGSAGTLELFTTAASFGATIIGFAAGDAIAIADATITSATWAAGTLTLAGAGGASLALALPGSFGTADFVAQPDGFGGSAVTLATPHPLPASAGTLALTGLVTGSGSADVVQAGSAVALAGSLDAGSLDAAGQFTVLPGGTLAAGTVTLAGSLVIEGAMALGGAAAAAGTLAVGAGATLAGSGRIDAALACDGVLAAADGALSLFGDAAGAGTLTIGRGATLFASGSIAAGLTVAFDAGATLDLASPAAFAGSLAGLTPGDAVDAAFATLAGVPALAARLAAAADAAGAHLATASDGDGGTLVTIVPCFCAGTRIATPGGQVAVERLRAGDPVLALDGGVWVARRVCWVGRTTIDLARHPEPERAAPIRIRAGAVADGVPARDLLVSPDHALCFDGALIQARALLNGATVTQAFPARVQYVHVELDRHAVLLAEGLPAESYLDTGNRGLFAGERGVRPLSPDLAGAVAWDERACAPLLLGGARVAATHARLLARAQAGGALLTEEAGLAVLADGHAVAHDRRGRRMLPAGTRQVRLTSRSFVPAWLGLGADGRRLGVAVRTLRLDRRRLPRAAFGPGWHAAEPGWRWTDGDAALVLPPLPCPAALTLTLAPVAARYWAAPA